jgi:hypothetical protein
LSDKRTHVLHQAQRIRETIRDRHGFTAEDQIPGVDAPGALEEAARLATVTAHWGIASGMPVIGRIVVLVRRSIRILLRWYINPIVEQQNAFNDATVRALFQLQAENDKLRAELAERKTETVEK